MRPSSIVTIAAAIAVCACAEKVPVTQNAPATTARSQSAGPTPANTTSAEPAPESVEVPAYVTNPPHVPTVLPTDTVGDQLALVFAIDTSVSLGGWTKAHPVDSVVDVSVTGNNELLCRTAMATVKVAGRPMVRSAVFDISAPPIGEKLPVDSADALRQLCMLRTVWITAQFPDSGSASTFADSLGRTLSSRLGAFQLHSSLFTYEAEGAVGKTWKKDGTTVVLAVAPARQEETTADSTKSHSGSRILLVAYASGSNLETFDAHWSREKREIDENAKSAYHQADSAIAWANVPAIAADLRLVIAALREKAIKDEVKRDPRADSALLRAVKATHDIAPSLPPPRRAAALLAADIVLFASMPFVGPDTAAPLNRALSAAGITFDYLPIDQEFQNTRPWLWEAYRLDSVGRAGHAAFLELLSLGWSTRGACNEGGSDHTKIIEHGEAAIARGDTDPMVHYYVASAYKTTWDAAHESEGSELVDPRPYRAQAESARQQAIKHYRAALPGLAYRAERRTAWMNAVKLMLGRSEQPEHICFYD